MDPALVVREAFGERVRAGITLGITYAGMVGIPLRGEYTCLGNAVNLTPRLMRQTEWSELLLPDELAEQPAFHFAHKGDCRRAEGYCPRRSGGG